LAASLTHLIVDALLRAYQHGARMAQAASAQRGELDPSKLEQAASQARQQARAVERSARLLLSHIHDIYDIARDKKRFVDGLRLYPLEVLHESEKEFRKQVHREDIRDRASYFAAIVRRCHDEYKLRRARQQQEARERRERKEHDRAVEQQRQQNADAPAGMIREGLELVALQWDSTTRQLLFDGEGPGKGMLCKAFFDLANKLEKMAAADIVKGVLSGFEVDDKLSLNDVVKQAIRALVYRIIGYVEIDNKRTSALELLVN